MNLELVARPLLGSRGRRPPQVRRDSNGNVYEQRVYDGQACWERMNANGETAGSPAHWDAPLPLANQSPMLRLGNGSAVAEPTVTPEESAPKRRRFTGVLEPPPLSPVEQELGVEEPEEERSRSRSRRRRRGRRMRRRRREGGWRRSRRRRRRICASAGSGRERRRRFTLGSFLLTIFSFVVTQVAAG